MIHAGIVGHRYLRGTATSRFVARQCSAILRHLQIRHTAVTALSAIAEGADTLFAEAALVLHIPLEIVHPFEGYASDFSTIHAHRRYERLRRAACTETRLGYPERSNEAYIAAMDWIVGHSDILIAAWNSYPAVGTGGTEHAVKRVIQTNRP
jgi:hypothetical protein